MTDATLNRFISSGTNAERLAFTPDPPTPASGPDPSYVWFETDTGTTYAWDYGGSTWEVVGSGAAITQLTGDVTAGPGVGSQVATIANGAVTLAKQANMATASVVYRKTAGAGAPEVQTLATLKTDLALTGTNSGDQTTIVGITGTKAEFDTAVTDGNFLFVGDITQYTDELAQDAIGAMVADTASIDITYTDATPELKADVKAGGITYAMLADSARGYEAGPPTIPLIADFVTGWLNQDTSTATDGNGALIINPAVNGEIHSLVTTVPGGDFDIYCHVEQRTLSSAANTTAITQYAGIVLRDSADNEVIVLGALWSRVAGDEQITYSLAVDRWTADGGTVSAGVINLLGGEMWEWLRVRVAATLIFYGSINGHDWHQIGTEAQATFIDAVTHYGAFAYASANATTAIAEFSYFSTTAPS